METVKAMFGRHAHAVRIAWLALLLVLAACNTGDNSGGGGGY